MKRFLRILRSKRGETLVETLVSIVIFAILFAVLARSISFSASLQIRADEIRSHVAAIAQELRSLPLNETDPGDLDVSYEFFAVSYEELVSIESVQDVTDIKNASVHPTLFDTHVSLRTKTTSDGSEYCLYDSPVS